MKVSELTKLIEEEVPLHYAESFDNVGLLVGDKDTEVTKVLVTLDTLETVVDEAIIKGCNLIISFHPILFKGLKNITGKNYVERVIIKAIQNNIAIYAIHTALDNHIQGVNQMICDKLGLENQKILIPKKETIKKLNVFVPFSAMQPLRQALFDIGAGSLGNYTNCSFTQLGEGTFRGNEHSNPTIGEKNKTETVKETLLQLTFKAHLENKVLATLFKAHPYEEVAYELTTLENSNYQIGMGKIGELQHELTEKEALQLLKKTFKIDCIKHSALINKPVKKIAVLGGSGAFAIPHAKTAKADMYITADIKYHEFYQAENQLVIADIGHYESEQYTKDLIVSLLTKKISIFAPTFNLKDIILSEINTNPIKYF